MEDQQQDQQLQEQHRQQQDDEFQREARMLEIRLELNRTMGRQLALYNELSQIESSVAPPGPAQLVFASGFQPVPPLPEVDRQSLRGHLLALAPLASLSASDLYPTPTPVSDNSRFAAPSVAPGPPPPAAAPAALPVAQRVGQEGQQGQEEEEEDAEPAFFSRQQCTICGEPEVNMPNKTFLASCGHTFCRECLVRFLCVSADEESANIAAFPPSCCPGSVPIDLEEAIYYLWRLNQGDDSAEYVSRLAARLRLRARESATPLEERVYCGWCRAFLPLDEGDVLEGDAFCAACANFTTCVACSEAAHVGPCRQQAHAMHPDAQLEHLAHSRHWRRCPGCGHMIEQDGGCEVMTCICEFVFCFECGLPEDECQGHS